MNIGTLTGAIEIEDQVSSTLSLISNKVSQFAQSFDGAMGAIAISAGVVATALGAVTGAIVALGVRGSDIDDVSNTLNRFAGSAENAKAILDSLSAGTLGTVTNFDLMKASSKLLAADVKLSADQFGILGQAATVLSNQGLGPTKDMLDLVSQAMLTGQTRSLQLKIGKIDLSKAEEKFAASVGLTKDQLNEAGKLEAKRVGLLDALSARVKEAGVQERSFAASLEFAWTQIKNWTDRLAQAVSSSPQVMGAINAIGTALRDTFGGTTQTVLEMAIEWINKFAGAVTTYAPPIIVALGKVRDFVLHIWDAVQQAWNAIPDWFKKVAAEAALAGIAIYGVNKAAASFDFPSILGNLSSFATIWSVVGTQVTTAITAMKGMTVMSVLTAITTTFATALTAALLPAVSAVGTVLGILTAPISLIIIGVGALAFGIRYLTGSWEFLLAPLRTAWQVLQDVWTIASELGGYLLSNLSPIVNDLKDSFGAWASLLKDILIVAIRDTITEVKGLWESLKNVPGPVKDILDQLKLVHLTAELIRGKNKVAEAPSVGPLVPLGSQLPGASLPAPTVPSAGGGGRGSADRYRSTADVDAFEKSVRDLSKTLLEGDTSLKVFESAFKRLTPAQLASYDVQQRLAPQIEKLASAGKPLSDSMREVYMRFIANREAIQAQEENTLALAGVTLQSVEANKLYGLSMQEIAFSYDVNIESLNSYLAELQKQQGLQENIASFEAAAREEAVANAKRKADAQLTAHKTIATSQRELDDLIKQSTMTTTDFQIEQIKRETAERIAAFSLSGASIDQIEEFSRIQTELSHKRTEALMVDNDALRENSQSTLDEIANKTARTYNEMIKHPEEYSEKTIREFGEIADAARQAADGTAMSWGQAFGSMKEFGSTLASSIMGAIQGGGNIAGSIGSTLGTQLTTTLSKKLTEGAAPLLTGFLGGAVSAVLPGLGALLGPLASKIGSVLFKTEGKKVNNIRDEFLSQFDVGTGEGMSSGFHQLAAKLAEIGTVGTAAFEKLRTASKTNDIAAAMQLVNSLLDEQKTKQEEAAAAAEDAHDRHTAAIDGIISKYSEQFKKIDSEYKSLADSVAGEAEEEFMGIVETQQRARMAQLEIQKQAVTEQRDAEVVAAADSIAATGEVGDAIGSVTDKLMSQEDAWKIWATNAITEAEKVYNAVNAVSFGHSPGGIQEIPIQLGIAASASDRFGGLFVDVMKKAEGAIPEKFEMGPMLDGPYTVPRPTQPGRPASDPFALANTPGRGSDVGDFVPFMGGWVPKNHPLLNGNASTPAWAPGPMITDTIPTTPRGESVDLPMIPDTPVNIMLDGNVVAKSTAKRLLGIANGVGAR